jgi:hypothetical protein
MKSLVLAFTLASVAVSASAQVPLLRARFEPTENIIVGQAVHLVAEVLVPNYFTGSPDFPTFEVENAIVVLSEDTPQNFNETVGGRTYAGIRRTYLLYPQQAGEFRLPPAQFTVPYANAPPKSTEAHLALPALKFRASVPAAAQGLGYFLPTTRLTMQQKWNAPLNKLRVGDTVERTIEIAAVKMQGMFLPPLTMDAPQGIKVYIEEPHVQDQKTVRGEFVLGRRVQSAKYFLEKEGDYTLPAIELKWWNVATNRLVSASLPAAHMAVAPNPGYVVELPPEAEAATVAKAEPASHRKLYRSITTVALWALAVLGLVWMAYRYVPKVKRILDTKRTQYAQSEGAYFRSLIRACRRNDALGSYRWLLRWLAHPGSENTLDRFLYQSNDEELTRQVEALTSTLFSTPADRTWSGPIMADRLRDHRKRLSLETRRRTQLPSLNP